MDRARPSLPLCTPRSAAALLAAALLALATGCTADTGTPADGETAGSGGGGAADSQWSDPQAVARAFAAGLSTGDLSGVPLERTATGAATDEATGATTTSTTTGTDPTAALKTVLSGMGDRRPTVTVTAAETPDADTGLTTATLSYSWAVTEGRPPWTYEATLPLTRDGESWRAIWSATVVHPDLETGQRLVARTLSASRGRILGAGGTVLVTDRPVRRVGLDRSQLTAAQIPAAAAAVAKTTGINAATYTATVRGAGPAAFVEAITYRRTDESGTRAIAALRKVPGFRVVEATLSRAATRTFARPLLGSVGEATAEVIAASGGTVRMGDVVGLSGLQKSMEATLRGTPSVRILAESTDPAVPVTRILTTVPGVRGTDVRISLDATLQARAESILAGVGPASAIVALDVRTGDVLAAASGPGSGGYSTATLGQYAPGSTFKVVSALGVLRAGLTPASTVRCPATVTVDGRRFKNYDAYPAGALGSIPLRTAFANSCNTAMIGQADAVSQDDLAAAAGSLGLGSAPALGVPAYLGTVPRQVTAVEHAASMIGQSRITASPLGMATVAASVAAGRTIAPRLVLSPTAGTPTGTASAPAAAARAVTSAEATALRAMMRAVVTEGSGGVLGDLGAGVLAKTGTAEFGTGNPPETHAWMLGVRRNLAVAVFVDKGQGGARTAGPLLHRFLS